MESFAQYIELLLPAPLKKVRRPINHFIAFCRFAGSLFDDAMAGLFSAREQAKLLSCDPLMLPEHGRERGVAQLEGETPDAYRARLIAQFAIAQKAGTTEGIQLAVRSLGCRNVTLEAVRKTFPGRWAEFFVWIGGTVGPVKPEQLDRQVRKVKKATSLACYGVTTGAAPLTAAAYCGFGVDLTVGPYWPGSLDVAGAAAAFSTVEAAISLTIESKEE